MAKETILTDETLFSLAHQGQEYDFCDLLINFLNCCVKGQYSLRLSPVSKRRLGIGWHYRPLWFPRRRSRENHIKKLKDQAEINNDMKNFVDRFSLKPKWFLWGLIPNPDLFMPFKYKNRIMHLFAFANAEKEKVKGVKLTPEQIIPLETCEVAYIAHTHRCTLISANSDFDFFNGYCGQLNYINFFRVNHFLEHVFSNKSAPSSALA